MPERAPNPAIPVCQICLRPKLFYRTLNVLICLHCDFTTSKDGTRAGPPMKARPDTV